ncbi:twin-arginine translocase subunit TatC [Stenotrophobium rhamnosiphilum]|uniref:Sec-independent protein translocase protein TatC n=1 Tax=Stenotrophobium rhamnosiphilum TaxID=2029166 RepID=A0A2T5MFR3_9GAMM|nr:twin-arginine translocase subunit TatC [Stenotrophobium rhamnosiphilum]PTU31418.1 twin-arginine translocase subunit TatC [Stenotrophobium rhamnosiphilum]
MSEESAQNDTEPTGGTEQPLISHLLELRTRLVRIFAGIFVCFLPLAYFRNEIYTWVAQPLLRLMPEGSSMIATEVAAPFFAPIKLAGVLAFAVAIPWILFQIWAFVAPGLYKNEKRLVGPLLTSSTLLFYSGVAFAYYLVLPSVFHFLVNVAPEGVAVMTDINKYLDFIMSLFLAFGLAFETPVAIVLLVRTGFVTPKQLAARRDYVLVGIFVVAAVVTPPDVLSQTLLAVPAYLLYELGILVSRWMMPDADKVVADSPPSENNAA